MKEIKEGDKVKCIGASAGEGVESMQKRIGTIVTIRKWADDGVLINDRGFSWKKKDFAPIGDDMSTLESIIEHLKEVI